MKEPTVQQYRDWPELVLPVKHSRLDLHINTIAWFCYGCNRPMVNLRGVIREWPTCFEVEFAGACPRCKIITFASKFRWYPWGVLVFRKGTGWVEIRRDWRNIFRNIFDRFFKRSH